MSGIQIDRKLIFNHKGQVVRRLRNNSGGTVNAGAVVIYDTTATEAFTTTTAQDDPLVVGVCLATVSNGNYAEILQWGFTDLLKVDGTTDIVVGDILSTFTTAGIAAKRSAVTKPGIFAIALEAYATNDANGVIDAWIVPHTLTDASGNTLTYGTAGQMAADGVAAANAAGSTAAVSRVDHAHTNTADTPALTLGTSNSAGTAGSVLAADATVAAFDSTVPTTIQPDATAATGSAAYAARRDHTHGLDAAAPSDGSLTSSNAEGSGNSFSRSTHTHRALVLDDIDIDFGTGYDAILGWSTADASNHALVLGLDDTSKALHISSKADAGTDWNVAADSHPSVYVHSETTPTTDYVKMAHDATEFKLTVLGGNLVADVPTSGNVELKVNNTQEWLFDATDLTVASGNYVKFAGNNGLKDSNGNEVLEVSATAAATEGFLAKNGTTAARPTFGPNGTGATANYGFELVDSNGNEVVELVATASAVNGIRVVNSATGVKPIITNEGEADTGIQLANYDGANTEPILILYGTATGANYYEMVNATAGNAPTFRPAGSDANITMRYNAKGTGKHNFSSDTAGTAALPTIHMEADSDTGFWPTAANQIGVSTGGTARATFGANGLMIGAGAVAFSTVGTNNIVIEVGTPPSGTATNAAGLYAADATAALYKINDAGTATIVG